MRPKTLKQSIMLAVALLIVASATVISQIVAHRYGQSLVRAATARAENIAHNLALDAADKVLINDLVALQKLLDDQMAVESGLVYLFVSKGGRIITHTFSDGVPVHLIDANLPIHPNIGHLEKLITQNGEHILDVAWPIFDGKAGILRLGLSEEPFRKQVAGLWVKMSLTTAVIVVIALFVSHLLINRLTRPLIKLTEAAEEIDEGALDSQVDIEGREEVTKLVRAFNAMLSRIQKHTKQLKEYNVRLERKNQELDRAHRQLQTSFSISQKIASLPGLNPICRFLLRTLRDIVECSDMNILVFNGTERRIDFTTPQGISSFGSETYDGVYDALIKNLGMTVIRKADISNLNLPELFAGANQIALFPIRYHDLLLGAMIVVCPGDCRCVRHELDIVTMILNQTAGAIHRANIHEEEIRDLRLRVEADTGFSGLVGKDPKMHVVFKLIEDVAPTDATVLIQGESGTGKELVARAIHDRSHRSGSPFIVINCSAYPSTLLESELFGHEKGAFTGALRRKRGKFERADGGTVFLDEIGEIDPAAQTKLLRVLQQQSIDRLGGDRSIKVNVRILAATNKNLLEEVHRGTFREDLFYRLNVIPIQLPPLRDRRKDIHRLARYFLARFAKEQEKPINGFRSEAMKRLFDYSWPGNVRELENTIEHAVVLAKESLIGPNDLPVLVTAAVTPPDTAAEHSLLHSEEKQIKKVLDECEWNKTEAARRLGISRSTLYEKLKKYRIMDPTVH